jgi:hypothetical protein
MHDDFKDATGRERDLLGDDLPAVACVPYRCALDNPRAANGTRRKSHR